ncbi:MAG: PASTA domain-containing protein [Ignavibacteriales bacterium]|nr:PASTA domain-containing protein [Ignavibacteriales bacterium]
MTTTSGKLFTFVKRTSLVLIMALAVFFIMDDIVMPRYVQQGETTYVPNVVGLSEEASIRALEEAGLKPKVAEIRPDKNHPEGTVSLQTPAGGSEVKFGRGIYLTISGGETPATVPALRGRSIRDARLALERFGLRIGELTYEVSTQFPENTVIDQSIPSGTTVHSGTTVSLTVSQGPSADRLPVPSVIRKSLTEAERLILRAGFTIGNITFQVNNDILPNTVIEQYPREGNFAPRGEAIQLFVTQRAEKPPMEN